MPCFAWRWIACSTALRGKRQSHLRARPAYPKGITLSAGFPRTLIWFWIGMSWSMVSMNHRKNAQTPNRMPSIKRRTEKPKFSWQKLSARRSEKGFLLNLAFQPILRLTVWVSCRRTTLPCGICSMGRFHLLKPWWRPLERWRRKFAHYKKKAADKTDSCFTGFKWFYFWRAINTTPDDNPVWLLEDDWRAQRCSLNKGEAFFPDERKKESCLYQWRYWCDPWSAAMPAYIIYRNSERVSSDWWAFFLTALSPSRNSQEPWCRKIIVCPRI